MIELFENHEQDVAHVSKKDRFFYLPHPETTRKPAVADGERSTIIRSIGDILFWSIIFLLLSLLAFA